LKDLLLQYCHYNRWANERLLDFICTRCSDEQVNREIVSSFSSIRKTLLHTWGAESIWLLRLQGESPGTWKWMDHSGTLDELRQEILGIDSDWIRVVEKSSDDFLQSALSYQAVDGTPYSNPVSGIIQHCINHSTFHRGQLVTMLRQLGFTKLVATDLIAYLREKK